MPKPQETIYQHYETFRQGLKWKEGTTDDEIARALSVLQSFIAYLVKAEWQSGVTTRRDQFAMAALQGIIAHEGTFGEDEAGGILTGKDTSRAYAYADAMIAESAK